MTAAVRFTEILAVKVAVRGAVLFVQPWLRIQVLEQQQRQRDECEAFIVDGRMWLVACQTGGGGRFLLGARLI